MHFHQFRVWGILSQAPGVLLPYAGAPPPDRPVLLLSRMSQLLSVCNPSGFHGWGRPSIFDVRVRICTSHGWTLPSAKSVPALSAISPWLRAVGIEPIDHPI